MKFKYKGDRTYVHGTDIFTETLAMISKIHNVERSTINIDMSIHEIIRNCMDLHDVSNSQLSQKPKVIFTISDNDNFKKTFFLIENNHPVIESYPYPEEEIIKNATFDDQTKTIRTSSFGNFSFIENVVALNKGLLGYLYSNSKPNGKWYFTKIKLRDFYFNHSGDFSSLDISFKKNMDFRLTDSEITVDDKKIGNVYFSLV